ncbi:unnamed protein product [Diabrotica balteata]|uniref:beta-glucosidase n=1 Tax=Diabrotica balteata TaxID=107213 RepID=A0A9N9T0Y5_DIABA|nr:unnamed protein product [Diabrotica balteata]
MKFLLIWGVWLATVTSDDSINSHRFPKNFKFGVANAAPQIEGGALEDGKSESIWDTFTRVYPERMADRSSPAVACDSYHKYKEDVALVKAMGLDHYRFSIAWSRILPTGLIDQINEPGVQYYKNLLNELKANKIEPLVTINHWDLPQALHESMNGWLNETIIDIFGDYARLCYQLFGDSVKLWTTINEPKQVCRPGYGTGVFPPNVNSNGVGEYICVKNILLAHARAYHIYDKEFREKQQGKVTIILDSLFYEPGSDSEEDKAAVERGLQFDIGIYANPIYNGDWPQLVKDRIAYRSKLEGLEKSRLPELTKEEIDYIRGTYDFFALNHYSTNMVNSTEEPPPGNPSYEADQNIVTWHKPEWEMGSADWFWVVPEGLRHFLNWIRKNYGDVEIFITENGFSDTTGILEDYRRINYYEQYLSSCLNAIYEDNIKLIGYTAWSIIDDWEWMSGYTSFLGMYRVNFTDPERTRTKRLSAEYFTKIVSNRCLVDEEKCIG